MSKLSNISQIATTTTPEKKMSPLSSLRRHIYDGLTYPSLQLSFYLSGPAYDRVGFKSWLGRADCKIADDPSKADFVIFTGGSDVDPSFYKEAKLQGTHSDPARDRDDYELYQRCVLEGIPMLGICRGAQFLWVMQGGDLYQDVDNHNDGEHYIKVFDGRQEILASSVHHQMVRPGGVKNLVLIACSDTSRTRKTPNYELTGPSTDFEIWAHREQAILCFQGHPEYEGFPAYSKLAVELIKKYIYSNDRTVYSKGVLRLRSVVATKEKK